jgi:multidrug resistance protein MdtO
VGTSSERLSYAGLQMAFAFFLGVLQGYGPGTDLTVLRDRVVGILLGNLLMSLVFSVVWPVSAMDEARTALANALRALGRLLAPAGRPPVGARVAVLRALGEARRLMSLAGFELRMLATPPGSAEAATISPDRLERLAAAAFVVSDQEPGDGIVTAAHRQDSVFAEWFEAAAARLSARKSAPPLALAGAEESVATAAADTPALTRAAVEARALLKSEIENAHFQSP